MSHTPKKICSFLMGVLCLFSLSICTVSKCAAQNKTLKPGTDTLLIRKLISRACKLPPDSAILLCSEPLKMSIASNYNWGALEASTLIAKCYSQKSDFQQCILANRRAMAFTSSLKRMAQFYNNIGGQYQMQGDYVHASLSYDSCLRALQSDTVEHPNEYLSVYNSLAILSGEFKQDSNTINYLNKAEAIARKWNLQKKLIIILSNKAEYYQVHKELNHALLCITEAKSIVDKNNFKDNESEVDQSLGSIYLDSGLNEKAITYFQSALIPSNLRSSESPELVQIFSPYGIATALYKLGKYKQAEATLVPAMQKAAALQVKEGSIDAYLILENIYRATQQYKKALDCADSLIALKDSLTSSEKAKDVYSMLIKYEAAEKDNQISQNQLMIAEQKNKIAQKNIWMISTGATVLLLLLVLAGVYLRTLTKQKAMERENKIGMLKAAVTGSDNERCRIARELHDGIGGMLSAAMMRFSSMHHDNPAITQTAAYNDAMNILREMGDEIRKTAHNLMPEVLLKQSLPEVVRVFCNNVQVGHTMKIDFQSYGSFDELAQNTKLNLYRISQELIRNALVHSGASRISVQLLQNEDKLMLSVEDNGSGFNVNERKSGIGLHNIRTRVLSLDGHLTIESEPGKGTTIIIEFELVPHALEEMAA